MKPWKRTVLEWVACLGWAGVIVLTVVGVR
jgi:hypothetical protein